jgi:RHS repeat-associated protein
MSAEKKPAAAGPASSGQSGAAYPLDRYTVQPKSEQQDSPYYQSKAPGIELPKGGGALKGIDEKFTVNAVNGSSSLEVPLPASPGRAGFTPALALSYNSGGGNSEFGLGWGLSLPAIQRKTDKQLPRYDDANDSDVFVLAGAEDLVPELDATGTPLPETWTGRYWIRTYRPRIEGLFARIERIRDASKTGAWWRVTTRDNITTWYGISDGARLADPGTPGRIFRWLPEIVCDHKGNVQYYTYVAEDLRGVSGIAERNRLAGLAKIANKYLKQVAYCYDQPWFCESSDIYAPTPPGPDNPFRLRLVLDYGDHSANFIPEPDQPWEARSDAFSDFHAGFEIRTYRRCRGAMMFHSFYELHSGNITLVRSLELVYEHDSSPAGILTEADYITSILQHGHESAPDGSYLTKSLPAITLTHQPLRWDTSLHSVSPEDAEHSPQGLTGPYQWVDLLGEGLPGILTEQSGGWFYKRNLGAGHFEPAEQVSPKPNLRGLGQSLQWQDLDADGRRQLVSRDRSLPGYFELNDDQQWEPFRSFPSNVNVDWNSPYTHLLDLDGDGRPDILMTREIIWTWFRNKGTDGIAAGGHAFSALDEENGPQLLLEDRVQRIFLADMNGDGLTDIVRITNGEICYWPNKGYGRFGARVSMAGAPRFDNEGDFNPQYLSLADISGTGAPDLIYLGNNRCTAWINLAGNGWSEAHEINPLPGTDAYSKIAVLDFLGNGTGCIVWSSPLPQHAHAPIRYIDLMGGVKPYLMRSYENGMGKKVSVEYRSSTGYYLDDRKAGRHWASKLPFPVQCVSEIVTEDLVSETRYKQRYGYHHGYYDHEEREFRGFGRVDTIDTETAAYYTGPVLAGQRDLDQAPVLTLTWYHTGAWMRESSLLEQFRKEYFQFEHWDDARVIADIPAGLDPQELREAHRALKGSALRQEVYALDGSAREHIPYAVTASAYTVKRIQPLAGNRHAVFLNYQQESVSFSCERNAADPRIAHHLTLAIDEYGDVLKSAQVVYGRQHLPEELPQAVQTEQAKPHIVVSENTYTADKITAAHYRLRLPATAKTFELTCGAPAAALWTLAGLSAELNAAAETDFLAAPANGTKRLLGSTRSRYLANDTTTVLPAGQTDTLGLPYEQYQLAFTAGFTAPNGPYAGKVDAAKLSEGGYRDLDGDGRYWLPSGTTAYTDPAGGHTDPATSFYMPVAFTDPFGKKTSVSYLYWMLPWRTVDALGNTTRAGFDWRVMQPDLVIDINNNRSRMAYDSLGMPAAMALQGKMSWDSNGNFVAEADDLDNLDLRDEALQAQFWADPQAHAAALLGHATMRCVYDLGASPVAVAMIGRERHVTDDPASPVLIRISYTDGLGRVAMHKVQAADDPATGADRWTGSGKTVYNNKGKAVLQYEPYFSSTHAYDPALQAAASGVSPRMHYDPLGRAWKTEMPDGTFSYTDWDPWRQTAYDANDTLGSWIGPAGPGYFGSRSPWYDQRIALPASAPECEAAEKAAIHADTPSRMHLDSLGRPFYSVQYNRSPDGAGGWSDEFISSYERLDVTGNRLEVTDGRGFRPLSYRYNLLQAPIFQHSIDGGDTYALLDISGQPLYSWDAAGRQFRFTYDALRRPLQHWGDGKLLGSTVYGENVFDDQWLNLRGRMIAAYDGAGKHYVEEYDFKGMPRRSFMRLLINAQTADADWSVLTGSALTSDETFFTEVVVDALGRPRSMDSGRITTTSGTEHNITTNTYGKDGALKTVDVTGAGNYVQDIRHNAKGQREAIWYGNGTKTGYSYDPLTQRLTRLLTVRLADNKKLQDLNYVYDPVGNITSIRDDAQETVWFNNLGVAPVNKYTYDALYRLVEARGRETATAATFPDGDNNADGHAVKLPSAVPWSGSTTALQHYTQKYVYDAVGNILELRHIGTTAGSYTRSYTYVAGSNRLAATQVSGRTDPAYDYSHDGRGNMTHMPHLSAMDYDLGNQMRHITAGTVQAYYQYSGGERVRKWVDKGSGVTEERIYYGSYEVYRKYSSTSVQVERTTLHVADDGGRIAMIEQRVIGTAANDNNTAAILKRFIYSNHLQSASLELDETGAVISYEEYHPYGTTAYQATNSAINAVAKRYRFTGKERDEESGLNYHGARYYIPWLCRWAAVDPKQAKYAAWSSYQYGNLNPINLIDPSGEASLPPPQNTTSQQDTTPQSVMPHMIIDGVEYASYRDITTTVTDRQGNSQTVTEGMWAPVSEGRLFEGTLQRDISYPPRAEVNDGNLRHIATMPNIREHFEAAVYPINEESAFSTRVLGGLKGIGGTLEMIGGAIGGAATAETGVGAVLGWAAIVHGADVAASGFTQMLTGEGNRSFTERGISAGLQTAGVSPERADEYAGYGDAAISVVLSGGKSGGGSGIASKGSDAVLHFQDYNQARNAALEWLESRGFRAESQNLAKMSKDPNFGRAVGMTDASGKIGFRIEYGLVEGEMMPHINVFDRTAIKGMQKGPHFTFPGDQALVDAIIKRFSNVK